MNSQNHTEICYKMAVFQYCDRVVSTVANSNGKCMHHVIFHGQPKCAVWPTKLQSVWQFGQLSNFNFVQPLSKSHLQCHQGCLHQNPGIFFILTSKAFAFPFQKQKGHLFHHSEFKLSFRKMRRNFLLRRNSSQIPKSVKHNYVHKGNAIQKKVYPSSLHLLHFLHETYLNTHQSVLITKLDQ